MPLNHTSLLNRVCKSNHIMIIAGEPSGDFHAAGLLKEIKKNAPYVRFTGIGGEMMDNQGLEPFFRIDKLAVMGVTEVISRLGIIKKAYYSFRKAIITDRPELLIVVDYPGFNLRAAAFAWKHSVPVLYYITPKVWAWNRSRIKKLKKYISHAALILPFEEPVFKKENIPSTFVGNPLLDHYSEHMIINRFRDKNGGNAEDESEEKVRDEFVIGLLPGSREAEIS